MGNLWFLEKILPPKNKVFFEDFEKAADVCYQTAKFFVDVIKQDKITEENIIQGRYFKHFSNDIEREIIIRLNNSFITPIDREDIQSLAFRLNKIPKKLVQVCMNLNVYRLEEKPPEIAQQAHTILHATEELKVGIGLLSTIFKTQEITDSCSRMKEIEGYGDDILYRAMEDLFSGKFEALEVIKLRNIYGDLESTLDNCFSISEEILNIALKNN